MILLDGTRLAQMREPRLRARADAVREKRGRAPSLAIVAFGSGGIAPWLERKLKACRAAGLEVHALIVDADYDTNRALEEMASLIERTSSDGLFLQIPAPPGIDEAKLMDAIPPELDVDVMTSARTRAYFDGDAEPPVTISAALEMLRGYDVDIRGRAGVLIADASPFAAMFREALTRAGAIMAPTVAPFDDDVSARIADAMLVVSAAARPRLISTADIARGSVVIDAGYYNPGGIGDIDISAGTAHLDAFGPVPGGIGPMTVSALLERVVRFAEAGRPV